ncbi:hypothetical protein Daus18300_012131 [Diaporthe australafricana]|uniref:DUF6604 domain-containing protein n=1 Tax=Diaporthe australafricana TaxID=127596 RepID=A0ABR3W441_9PEZI
MGDFILQTWEEYRDSKLDLMSASVVTDTALQLAQAAIEELVQDPSIFPSLKGDEMALQQMLYDVTCKARGQQEHPSIELGLPFNVNAADTANWFFIVPRILLTSFVPVMQQDDLPDFIQGYFGVIDKKADRSRMSVSQRLSEDKIFLLELLPEFCMMDTHGFTWPVLLDIYDKLRMNPAGPWNDLRMAGLRFSKTIADFKLLSATHPKPAFWPKEGDQEINNIQNCIDGCIKHDIQQAIWELGESNQVHEEHFFFKKNPILSGLLMFQLTSRMQVIGQSLVNQWYDVQQMAFLYNLAQQVPDVRIDWPDIEAFIKIHGENRIFVGDRPKNAAESLNRLQAATGISSVTRFARDSRRTGEWHRPDGKSSRLLEPTTRVTNMFRDSYGKSEQTRNIANADFGRLLDDMTKTSPAAKKATKQGKKDLSLTNPEDFLLKKWSSKRNLGALQFLALVRTKLHEEEPALMFNYFGMHHRSIEMLRRIRDKEHHKFVQYFTPSYMPDESMISNLVILIHHVARGSAAASREMGLASHRDHTVVSRIIMSCGEVMREYLRTKGDVACKELRTFCKNKTPLYIESGGRDEEAEEKFMQIIGLEEVLGPRAMASLMTGIPG